MSGKYTSKDFEVGRFSAHGHYEIQKIHGVYHVQVIGPLNLEGIQALVKTRAKAFEQWGNEGPKLGIAEFRVSMLMSLEALNAYTASLEKDLRDFGRWKALAWVASPTLEGRSFMEMHFSKIFGTYQVPWQLFEDMDAASSWIASFSTTVKG